MVGSQYSGWADSMFPFVTAPNKMLYGDLQAQGSDNSQAMISAGLGYRYAKNTRNILGSYFFVDRERSAGYQYYTVLGPGLEWMTPTWSYRLNAYIPIGDKTHKVSSGWADEYGNYSYEVFNGHKQYDIRADLYENLSYGGDATLSYRFAQNSDWQINLSPYAYKQDNENAMMGGKAQVNYYSNDNTQVFIADEYDNKNKNSVIVGISFSFGVRNNDTSTTALINAPVLRNLMVNTSDNGLAVDEDLVYGDTLEVEENNIYFVDDNNLNNSKVSSSNPDGTYNNPYTSAEQAEAAPQGANIWLASSSSTPYTIDKNWTLKKDQSISGRSSDFKQDASGSDRPTIKFTDSDGIVMDSSNDLSHIQIMGSGHSNDTSNTGVTIRQSDSNNEVAQIDDIKVGSTNENTSYVTGITMADGAEASITNSKIIGYANTEEVNNVYWILLRNSNAAISDSTITAQNDINRHDAFGVYISSHARATIDSATINAFSNNGDSLAVINYFGSSTITNSILNATGYIAVGDYFTLTSVDSSINNSVINTDGSYASVGVYNSGSTADITIENNVINAESLYEGIGVYAGTPPSGSTIVNNNEINVSTSDIAAITAGILTNSGTTLISTDNNFDVEGNGAADETTI